MTTNLFLICASAAQLTAKTRRAQSLIAKTYRHPEFSSGPIRMLKRVQQDEYLGTNQFNLRICGSINRKDAKGAKF